MISVLELDGCRIAQPKLKLHIVRPSGKTLCGIRISARECFATDHGGWLAWRDWPAFRCQACQTEAESRWQR